MVVYMATVMFEHWIYLKSEKKQNLGRIKIDTEREINNFLLSWFLFMISMISEIFLKKIGNIMRILMTFYI
jgi:hypothetical protein